MPVYDYLCDDCGAFTQMRPMAECEMPSECPDCGTSARRAFINTPNYSSLSRETRLVHATNERSAHAPKTLSGMKAEHGAGCSCCSGSSKKPGRLVRRGKNGSKTFPTARPWMISH